jgi:tetratricopeptide (TPR) repeat protein
VALSGDEALERVMELLRNGQREECAEFLVEQRDEASRSGRLEDAALLSSFLGSVLFSVGRDEDALPAYQFAEANDPSPWAALRTARHLLWSLGRTDEAAEKVKQVLSSSPKDSQEYLEARALEGCVALAEGETDTAVRALRELMESELLLRMPVVGWDFELVRRLAKRGIDADSSRQYLGRALAKARDESDGSTEARVLEILATLDA